ncbi:hypothetical protein SERLA73DRAFT_173698 [Serpula lacrymans var. lacrymans S7.3]|uniref:Uncharacterized protein n=1 Tax=Serpula lacrymans var. lacrymans (strain S7.3) TaxID=936435 RepID=F8PFS3_SERL3|nr:hypothetical protein SERLA73DRAFT_173698 [Serpula lacrymans var. lacrymans S7.3]
MSVLVSPSTSRGQVILQPSYFTSSLYVHAVRDDIATLSHLFADQYVRIQPMRPFGLFKDIWNRQGWTWLHFKVFDARSHESFLSITMRLFSERLIETEASMSRVVALFGLYTFFSTQPSSLPSLQSMAHLPISTDLYESLLTLPDVLDTQHLLPLQPHVICVLSLLVKALPREIFLQDGNECIPGADPFIRRLGQHSALDGGPKKRGRPTRREKLKKAKDAVTTLDKWLDRSSYTYQPPHLPDSEISKPVMTHILLSHPPTTTRNHYRTQKSQLLDSLDSHGLTEQTLGQIALERANTAVLLRLRKIDEQAAEMGMEVGGEGGERTGLARVERVVGELQKSNMVDRRGGILGLLEGSGIEQSTVKVQCGTGI